MKIYILNLQTIWKQDSVIAFSQTRSVSILNADKLKILYDRHEYI